MSDDVMVIGVGMTPMDGRDLTPAAMARAAASAALEDAGMLASDVRLVLVANALAGLLADQECVRGQAWLRNMELGGTPIVNVDNACAAGASAMHVASLAAHDGPVLAVGVEKMWTGNREATLHAIEHGLDAAERARQRDAFANTWGSVFMGMNAAWARQQMQERGATPEHFAAAAAKSRGNGALNPLAQHRRAVTVAEVLSSPEIEAPLTRLMCSSATDGAAAAVFVGTGPHAVPDGEARRAVRLRASVLCAGTGELEYHDRLADAAERAWTASGIGPEDLDVVEVHDATSAEELFALEALGFYKPGDAGPATLAGETAPAGGGTAVNTSGGLVARGHPLGATGLCQVVEIVTQLRGAAGARQVLGARLGAAVNTGGIIGSDAAAVGVHVFEAC